MSHCKNSLLNPKHLCITDATSSGGRSSRSRGGGVAKPQTGKGNGKKASAASASAATGETSENNSRSSSAYGGGRKFPLKGRGRNFSGDSTELYPFNLDGPPAYGEVVPEPAFVTPIIGGMAYYYDNQFNPTAASTGHTVRFTLFFHRFLCCGKNENALILNFPSIIDF